MEKGSLLYEGKAKRLYATDQEDVLLVEYKDSATAFNGEKKADISGKGVLNNKISSLIFSKILEQGISSHFIKQISDYEQLVKRVTIIPLEVVVRNSTAGSFAKRYGLEEGIPFDQPFVEFYFKDDELGDPLMTEDHIQVLKIANQEEIEFLKKSALQVNVVLKEIFGQMNIELVDFKLEFGKDSTGQIVLADEISPDTCRFWEKGTKRKLDKDVFRRDLGNLVEVYTEVFERLGGETACSK